KLKAKSLDLIVANDVSAADSGFAVDTNRVILLDAWGDSEPLPLMSKTAVAERVIGRVTDLLK
ncbi:MAG: phosphopantothenoylcysteine decarboxylase, partial [Anaerolineae bacterium]